MVLILGPSQIRRGTDSRFAVFTGRATSCKKPRASRPRPHVQLAYFDQAIGFMPVGAHVAQGSINFFFRDFFVGARQYRGRFALGGFQELAVANEVGDLKARHAGLTGAEKLTRTAQLKIEFGNLETVGSTNHGAETAFAVLGNFPAGHEDAKRFRGAPANASAKLVQLR